MRHSLRLSLTLSAAIWAGAAPPLSAADAVGHPELWPAAASPGAITDPKAEAFIDGLIARMSLEEKVGQVIQADISTIRPEDLRRYPLGSILAGGNSGPDGNERASGREWLEFVEAFRKVALEERAGHVPIPIMFGIDAVHGHNNVVGATIFPHNIGLGAARDPDLIRRIGEATARELAATGGDWTFGPTVAVPRDDRWGRTYEGYAEHPEVVRSYAGPMTLGLQGPLRDGAPITPDRVAGSAKHFLADGGTLGGRDQGDAQIPEADLVALHAQGYKPAIDAGILSVMTSFSSWNGVKHAANASLITDVLKGRMGFAGFVVSDWNAHAQIPGCTPTDCIAPLLAGLDMYMAPDTWKGLYDTTLDHARAGRIPMARLDDAVRRVLRAKLKAGLFEAGRQRPPLSVLAAPDHRALAREAVRKSLVLLKNNGGVLPIRPGARVLIAGSGADDIGKQSGGWTITWQGTGNSKADFPQATSIGDAIVEAVRLGGGQASLAADGAFNARPDVAVVVFGEDPYAEFQGDIATVEYQPGAKTDLALLKRLKAAGVPVVSVFISGRPLWVNPELNASDAFVAAWLPGSEGGGVADLLVAGPDGKPAHDFTGKLSYSWPKRPDQSPLNAGDPGYDPLFAYGYGLTYADRVVTPRLSEAGGQTEVASLDRYFVAGRTPPPWAWRGGGAVQMRAVDAGAQENAREAVWNGPGVIEIAGQATDLRRQAGGDMALQVRFRVDARPAAQVRLGSGGASLDVTEAIRAAPAGQWSVLKVKLACFAAAGADIERVTVPFALSTDAPFAVTLSEVRLEPSETNATCPRA